jgi:hypothetical protein
MLENHPYFEIYLVIHKIGPTKKNEYLFKSF